MKADKRMGAFGGRATVSPCHRVTLSTCLLVSFLLLTLAGCTAPVVVEWSTETEMNTAGFNLYRSTSPEGPFDVKVNEQLIPASPDPVTGGKYSFVDRTARPGVMYYYRLQEVEKTGTVNQYGPIAVRASGFDWRLGVVLGGLAAVVLALWIVGGWKSKDEGRRMKAEGGASFADRQRIEGRSEDVEAGTNHQRKLTL